MEKKNYMKPTMKVVELQHSPLLAGASPDGEQAYIPGMERDDMNKLA